MDFCKSDAFSKMCPKRKRTQQAGAGAIDPQQAGAGAGAIDTQQARAGAEDSPKRQRTAGAGAGAGAGDDAAAGAGAGGTPSGAGAGAGADAGAGAGGTPASSLIEEGIGLVYVGPHIDTGRNGNPESTWWIPRPEVTARSMSGR